MRRINKFLSLRFTLLALSGLLSFSTLILPVAANATPSAITAVGINSSGVRGPDSTGVALNTDGTIVAFGSMDGTLDYNYNFPYTNNGTRYLYIRDTINQTTKLVSIGHDGQPFTVAYWRLSSDGTKVVFTSENTNVINNPPTTWGHYLYHKDLTTNLTQLVSVDENGAPLPSWSLFAISADANTIGFSKVNTWNLYLRNVSSSTSTALPLTGHFTGMSADGRYLAHQDVFANQVARYDTQTGQNTVVNVDEQGVPQKVFSMATGRAMSADGTKVGFISAEPIIASHPNTCYSFDTGTRKINRIYVRDLNTNTTQGADVVTGGNDPVWDCQISGSYNVFLDSTGNKVTFDSSTNFDNYITDHNQPIGQVFVHDFAQNTTKGISRNQNGEYLNRMPGSDLSDLSPDGSTFGLTTYATNITPPSIDGNYHAYIVPTQPPVVAPLTHVFQPSADTYVRSIQTNYNFGNSTSLEANSNSRGLVRFDQSAIQSTIGSGSVTSAKLKLTITDNGNSWGPNGRPLAIHRLTTNWTEGDGNETTRGTGSGATWNCATDSAIQNILKNCNGANEWQMGQPNNPFTVHPWVSTPSATQTITNNQTGEIEYDVTNDVQNFLNSSTANYGWMTKKTTELLPGQLTFGSKESSTSPQLVIIYQP